MLMRSPVDYFTSLNYTHKVIGKYTPLSQLEASEIF